MAGPPVVPNLDGYLLLRGTAVRPGLSAPRKYTSRGNEQDQKAQHHLPCRFHKYSSKKTLFGSPNGAPHKNSTMLVYHRQFFFYFF
jgi:hypothetical protein